MNPLLYDFVGLSVVRSLTNGWTPSSSSEEEEQGFLKNADSSSAKSDDVKSEVGAKHFPTDLRQISTHMKVVLICFPISLNNLPMEFFYPTQVSTNSSSSQQISLPSIQKESDSRW